MFCIRCGKYIAEDVKFCPHCGAEAYKQEQPIIHPDVPAVAVEAETVIIAEEVVPAQGEKESIRSGLGLAITFTAISVAFSSVLSLVTGIIAIVFAALAKGKNHAGNVVSAKSKARVAKAMNVTTIILLILWIIMIVALIVFAVRATMDVADVMRSGDLVGMSAQELDEFLQEYGYNYDIDVLEEYLEHNFGTSEW